MSLAEPSIPALKRLQPLQKWYMLFPENWSELVLDKQWRMKRLKVISASRGLRYFGLWSLAALMCCALVSIVIGGFVSSGDKQNIRPQLYMLVSFVLIVQGQRPKAAPKQTEQQAKTPAPSASMALAAVEVASAASAEQDETAVASNNLEALPPTSASSS